MKKRNSDKYPVLYSRTSSGSIQTWQIIVENDSFYTIEGIQGGKLTQSKPTICEAKNVGRVNATTAQDQAHRLAKVRIKAKREAGYVESLDEVSTAKTKPVYFQPMLAHKWADCKDKVQFPVFCQPKLDGMRNITSCNGMQSRGGKPIISAPHIFAALKPLFDKYSNLILDGELYCDRLKDDFNRILSLVKKSKPSPADLAESAQFIQYWVYDLPSHNGVFSERSAELQKLVKELNSPYIVFVETRLATTQEELDQFYSEWLEAGMEGQMVRLDQPYENDRSRSLLKRKEFQDDEFKILEIEEGKGNRAGMAGKVKCITKDGAEFRAGIKGNMAYFRELWNNRAKLVGKMATIKYFQLTGDSVNAGARNVPRFGVMLAVRDYE